MKTTVLIYKEVNGCRKLVVATNKEWKAIREANQGLKMEARRLFEENRIYDNGRIDRMLIEVSYGEYMKWHREEAAKAKRCKGNFEYEVISLDAPVPDEEVTDSHEIVPSEYHLEEIVTDRVLMYELKQALEAWRPWAPELLDYYLRGEERTCTKVLCKKYCITDRAVQKRKKAFEAFVKNYLR